MAERLTGQELAELRRLHHIATAAPWYVVGQPWRQRDSGTYIVAGNPDPHAGTPVLDSICIDEWPTEQGGPDYSQSDIDLTTAATLRTMLPKIIAAAEREARYAAVIDAARKFVTPLRGTGIEFENKEADAAFVDLLDALDTKGADE